MNDEAILGERVNGVVANGFGLLVVGVAAMLGLTGLARAASTVFAFDLPEAGLMLPVFALLGVFMGRAVTRRTHRARSEIDPDPAAGA